MKMMVTPLMAACVVALLEDKNMCKRCRGKKVIRIIDGLGLVDRCDTDQRYFLEVAVWNAEQGRWSTFWVRVDGQPKSFARRCDASRWAGKHYPGWERQHWRTI